MTNKMNLRFAVLATLIFFAAFSRCIPHIQNFSPLGAISLFGAAYFSKKWQAFLVPLAATWLSDLFLNNVIYAKYYHGFVWLEQGFYWIYGTYALIIGVGFFILKKINLGRVIMAAWASTIIFYLITNFACWPGSSLYSQDWRGLSQCYIAGIPFIKGTLLGDLFYSGILFGSFEWARKRFPVLGEIAWNK